MKYLHLLDFGGGERPFFDLKKVCCLALVDRLDCPDHFCREGRRGVGLAARRLVKAVLLLRLQKRMEETVGGGLRGEDGRNRWWPA